MVQAAFVRIRTAGPETGRTGLEACNSRRFSRNRVKEWFSNASPDERKTPALSTPG
jgi:hypothetical protein